MKLLNVYLSAIDEARFKVIARSRYGQAEDESTLPFFETNERWRTTLIKALGANKFRASDFKGDGEQDWMVANELLDEDRCSFHPAMFAKIGQAMYRSLFPAGNVRSLLERSLAVAEEHKTLLHIQLEFNASITERSRLPDYPWELAHDGLRFLAHHQVIFSRYIAHLATTPKLPPVDRLNVLLISSSASDEDNGLLPLSTKEQKAVLKGLETAQAEGHIHLHVLKPATLKQLRTYLTENRADKMPHVLHFDGHGFFGRRCSSCRTAHSGRIEKCPHCDKPLPNRQGYLVFESDDDEADYISAQELGELLHKSSFSDRPIQTSGVAVAVLSACKTSMALGDRSVFNGVAQGLIGHQVPAVVAMQYNVLVDSATAFAEHFYRCLGNKESLAIAVSKGQAAIGADGNQWYRPALYLRWQDNAGGQLFAREAHSAIADSLSRSGVNNLPRSGVVKFVGREKSLQELHKLLQQVQPDQPKPVITAIQGMGGVGKTELAQQYAVAYQTHYPGGVCWLSVPVEDVGVQLVEFARTHLQLHPPENLDLPRQVAFCWQHWLPGEVLMVLDDVMDYQKVKPYLDLLPSSRFKVLITTRLQLGSSIEQLSLDVLKPRAALALLEPLIGSERLKREPWFARKLCNWLGYLPLGLELVGRYLKRKPDLCLKEMLSRLKAKRLEQLSLKKPNTESDMTAQAGVQGAFELSWKELDEQAKRLGLCLSLFALAPIPWYLVEQCLSDIDPEELEEARDYSLVNLHLVGRKAEKTYQLHQLIREFFSAKRQQSANADNLKRRYCKLMVTEAQHVPEMPTREQILALSPAIPHIAEAATLITQAESMWKEWLSEDELMWLYVGLGRFYEGQACYAQSEPWRQECLRLCQSRLGKEHPDVASSLNDLAELYRLQGRYKQAEPLFVQALEMRKRLLGEEHSEVATSLNNLALLYQNQERYQEAEPLFVQALEMRKRLLGEEDSEVATSLNNLALLYYVQQRYQEAEPVFVQARKLLEQNFGKEHLGVAINLDNLALLYCSQERYEEAELLFNQALELKKRLLGEKHREVAISLNNLALLHRDQKRYEEAEPFFVQALELNKQLLGKEHREVATSLNNLALLYDDQKRYEKAERLFVQALELRKRLGEEHPEVVISINNLAQFYKDQGRYEEAEALFVQALELNKRLLGEKHPEVAISINNLARLYEEHGRDEELKLLIVQAWEMYKPNLGETFPSPTA
jgi:tetratricopeptide (TPR) repeat protein